MARKQIRNRRQKAPVLRRATKAKVIIDGKARCRFNNDQKRYLRELCGISEDADPYQVSDPIHELEIIIQRYWQSDARRCVWPSNSVIDGKITKFIAAIQKLETLFQDISIRSLITHADLLESGRIRTLKRMLDADGLDALISELRFRASLVQANPGGREKVFKTKSNAHDPPFTDFLCELVRFWHLELGKPVASEGGKDKNAPALYDYCHYMADIAGRPMDRPALRLRVSQVIKAMDANDSHRRLNGQKPTLDWTTSLPIGHEAKS